MGQDLERVLRFRTSGMKYRLLAIDTSERSLKIHGMRGQPRFSSQVR